MGLFLSFLGGAATGLSEEIEKSEKEARLTAKTGVQAMYEKYGKVAEENKKLQSKLNEDKDFILAYHPNATSEQINELLARPAVMEAFKKYKDPKSVSLDSLVTVSKSNESDLSAADKVTALPDLVDKARTLIAGQYQKRTSPLGGLIDEFGQRAFTSAQQQTAAALGTTMEALTSQRQLQRPTAKGTVDMSLLTEKKSFTQREDDAKTALLDAHKSGDEAKIVAAKADMKAIETVKAEMTPAQTAFANKIADIKNRYMFGTPEERAAAKPEYDKMLADVRAEAAAKKAGEGKDDKLPSLGTLNTFTSAAVARKVAEVHGDLVRSKQLAIIEKPDGSASLEYTGDNQEVRAKINTTAYNAAKNALSLYMTPTGEPMTRDVAAVLNTYVPQSVMKQPVETPAAAPSAPAAPKSAVPTPASNAATLRKDAEAAISRGADRAAVAKRFKDQTGQEL